MKRNIVNISIAAIDTHKFVFAIVVEIKHIIGRSDQAIKNARNGAVSAGIHDIWVSGQNLRRIEKGG